jgi:5-methylcytosine-specific restriction endonuclease McrA
LAWDKDIGSRPLDAKAWQELYDRGMAHCSGPCDGYLPKSAFNKDVKHPSGVQSKCKPCDKVARADKYASMLPEDKERLLEAARNRTNANRAADPEKHREIGRIRRAKMTDEDKAAESVWKAQHYQKNKAEIAARQAAYYEANRDAAIERGRMERIRRKGVETDGHTCSVLHEYWEARGIDPKICTYCDKHIRNWKTSEGDHVVPLIKGGTDFMENIVPCCGSCNSSKGDRILYVKWWPINMRHELTAA